MAPLAPATRIFTRGSLVPQPRICRPGSRREMARRCPTRVLKMPDDPHRPVRLPLRAAGGHRAPRYGFRYDHCPWSVWGDADRIAPFNPLRRVPVLVMDDGVPLVESSAIL